MQPARTLIMRNVRCVHELETSKTAYPELTNHFSKGSTYPRCRVLRQACIEHSIGHLCSVRRCFSAAVATNASGKQLGKVTAGSNENTTQRPSKHTYLASDQCMRTSYLVTQLVGVSFVHRLRREQKGVICHLVCPIDISVAVGRHAEAIAVSETLRTTRGRFQTWIIVYLEMSPWINDSCEFKAADQRRVAFAVM